MTSTDLDPIKSDLKVIIEAAQAALKATEAGPTPQTIDEIDIQLTVIADHCIGIRDTIDPEGKSTD